MSEFQGTSDDELISTSVPRALEMKSKLFGFELPDLLVIFFNLALTNLIFGTTNFRYPLVWGSTFGLAFFIFFFKRGKPDGYVQHLGEFMAGPSYYASGLPDLEARRFRKELAHAKK